MKVLLSQEGRRKCWLKSLDAIDLNALCRSQARHLLKVLNEPCLRHPLRAGTIRPSGAFTIVDPKLRHRADLRYVDMLIWVVYRKDCPVCMAEIEELIKG